MGCNNDYMRDGSVPEDYELVKASLCGILTVLEGRDLVAVLDRVSWKEAGVRRTSLEAWWRRHKIADERRRKKEADERHRAEVRKGALARLTKAEKESLGLEEEE